MRGPLRKRGKRGKAKNKRYDAPLVTVGLAVTREGLPVRSWVFPGNTTDVTTVERVKADLKGWKLGRCIFVGDAGMNSEDNRRTLALGGGKYILAAKMRGGDEVTKKVMARAGRYQVVRDNLRVKEVLVGDGERRQRYVVCHNPEEAERQRHHRKKLLQLLEAELATLKPPAPGDQHSKRTCELLTSERFGRYLRKLEGGALRIDHAAAAGSALRREVGGHLQRRHADGGGSRPRLQAAHARGGVLAHDEVGPADAAGLPLGPPPHRSAHQALVVHMTTQSVKLRKAA